MRPLTQTRFLTWQFQDHDNGICHTSWSPGSETHKVSFLPYFMGQRTSPGQSLFKKWRNRLHLLIRRIVNYKRVCMDLWPLFSLPHMDFILYRFISQRWLLYHRTYTCLSEDILVFFSYTPGLIMNVQNRLHPTFNHEIHASLPLTYLWI